MGIHTSRANRLSGERALTAWTDTWADGGEGGGGVGGGIMRIRRVFLDFVFVYSGVSRRKVIPSERNKYHDLWSLSFVLTSTFCFWLRRVEGLTLLLAYAMRKNIVLLFVCSLTATDRVRDVIVVVSCMFFFFQQVGGTSSAPYSSFFCGPSFPRRVCPFG